MIDKRAYTEVNEIINNLPLKFQKKIPEKIRDSIRKKMDTTYNFIYIKPSNTELMEDTKKILSVLYTDYFSTEEERKKIHEMERKIQWKKELDKKNRK